MTHRAPETPHVVLQRNHELLVRTDDERWPVVRDLVRPFAELVRLGGGYATFRLTRTLALERRDYRVRWPGDCLRVARPRRYGAAASDRRLHPRDAWTCRRDPPHRNRKRPRARQRRRDAARFALRPGEHHSKRVVPGCERRCDGTDTARAARADQTRVRVVSATQLPMRCLSMRARRSRTGSGRMRRRSGTTSGNRSRRLRGRGRAVSSCAVRRGQDARRYRGGGATPGANARALSGADECRPVGARFSRLD